MDFADLVIKAQKGNVDAYGELVRRFQGMAFGYAYSLLGDFHLAQDAAQDALLQEFRDIAMIHEPIAWPTWLRRVVFKHCDRLRRRKRLDFVPLEAAGTLPDEGPLADERLVKEEMKQQVQVALNSLTNEERAITILFYLRGYSQRDIAEFLEIPLDTVKNRLRSARKKLYERMIIMTKEVLREETPSIHERFTEVNQLYEACEKGDIAKVTNLLQKYPEVLDGADRDATFPYPAYFGRSPLYQAALNGHLALVKILLDMGANPIPYEISSAEADNDWIDRIRERGYNEITDLLQTAIQERYGPLVDEANIHQAVREGDIEQVKALIKENPERLKQVDLVGNIPLHWAVQKSNMEIVRLLVESGSPIDARRGDGRAPTQVALFGFWRYWRRHDKLEILDYLLKNGAEYSILIAAAIGDIKRLRQLLRENPSLANYLDPCYRRPLSCAAEKGYLEIVKLLLEHRADPNAREDICQGGFALYTASGHNHLEVVRLLLEYGANPEHWVDSSGTALIGARTDEMRQLLYSYGATTEIQWYAAHYRINVVAEVLRLKPSLANEVLPYAWVDPKDDEKTAMDIMRLAIRYGARFENESAWKLRNTVLKYRNVARLLFEHGADPNVPLVSLAGDYPGRDENITPRRDAIAFLIEECGANVNHRDASGMTPLAAAAAAGRKELVEYLLSKGAEVNPEIPTWCQPLYLAKKNGHTEVAEILKKHGAKK